MGHPFTLTGQHFSGVVTGGCLLSMSDSLRRLYESLVCFGFSNNLKTPSFIHTIQLIVEDNLFHCNCVGFDHDTERGLSITC